MLRKPHVYRNRIELLQGTLDLLVLQTLQWGPRHGYGISQAIRAGSGDVLRADTGSLYPALHRLERAKWIAAEWKKSENQQRVRVKVLQGEANQADACISIGECWIEGLPPNLPFASPVPEANVLCNSAGAATR